MLDSKERSKRDAPWDSKETEVWLFFRIEGGDNDYGFLISQVLKGLESFVVFEKILEVSFL